LSDTTLSNNPVNSRKFRNAQALRRGGISRDCDRDLQSMTKLCCFAVELPTVVLFTSKRLSEK